MTEEGLAKFVDTHVGRGYAPRFEGAKTKFRNTIDDVPIDILLSGSFPGNDQTEIAFPEPKEISYEEFSFAVSDPNQKIRFVDLSNLVNLKLVCYKDLPDTRVQDFLDVRKLIESNALGKEFGKKLYPSVHDLFLKAVALNAKEQRHNDERD